MNKKEKQELMERINTFKWIVVMVSWIVIGALKDSWMSGYLTIILCSWLLLSINTRLGLLLLK